MAFLIISVRPLSNLSAVRVPGSLYFLSSKKRSCLSANNDGLLQGYLIVNVLSK